MRPSLKRKIPSSTYFRKKLAQRLCMLRAPPLYWVPLGLKIYLRSQFSEVWVYKKTFEEKFPTLKKYSDKAPSTDRFATHEVEVDYEYKSVEDESKVVPPEQRIKGYRYGHQVIPISSNEWDTVKFKPEKGIKLLGFTTVSNILRQGQANVVIGILTPDLAKDDHVPDSFYFNTIPFAKDIREFQFPSFENLPLSMLPNDQQQEAANNFVKSLDFATSDKEEVLGVDHQP